MLMARSVLATNIRRIIKEQGIKQYVIAHKAGYSHRQFSDMMNGRRTIKAEDVPDIAEALGVAIDELFATDETKSM